MNKEKITLNEEDFKYVQNYRPCCGSEWYRKGRANFRCKKCDSDVTIYVIYFANAILEDKINDAKI